MADLAKDLLKFMKQQNIPVQNISVEYDANAKLANIMIWVEDEGGEKDPELSILPKTHFNGNN